MDYELPDQLKLNKRDEKKFDQILKNAFRSFAYGIIIGCVIILIIWIWQN